MLCCADQAIALVIVTEWEQFRALDLERLKREWPPRRRPS
jgi:UDPglucose 6-dehydrogenase